MPSALITAARDSKKKRLNHPNVWMPSALITVARDGKKKRLNHPNVWRPSALITYPSNPGNVLAIRG
jgi:hypothetical protein